MIFLEIFTVLFIGSLIGGVVVDTVKTVAQAKENKEHHRMVLFLCAAIREYAFRSRVPERISYNPLRYGIEICDGNVCNVEAWRELCVENDLALYEEQLAIRNLIERDLEIKRELERNKNAEKLSKNEE